MSFSTRVTCLALFTVTAGTSSLALAQAAPPPSPAPPGASEPAPLPPAPPEAAPEGQPPDEVAPPPAPPAGPPGGAYVTEPPPPEAEPPPIYVEQPPPPPLAPRTRHVHDGFYLRLNLGVGYLHTRSEFDDVVFAETVEGGGWSFDVMAGGTPAKGLVVGGGLFSQDAFSPEVTVESGAELARFRANDESLGFALIGPFVDGFPDPNGGFHVGGAIGVASVSLEDDDGNWATGVGLSAWVGYQWWVSSQWSLGGMLRFTGAGTQREFDVIGNSSDVTRAVALSFSALYH